MKSFVAIIAIALTIVAVSGSAYGPAGLKGGPPCQKSVLVSCAPLVQSVPCKPGAGAAHVGGAYSEPLPQYAAPYAAPYSASVDEMAVPEDMAVPAASEYVPKYAVPNYTPYYRYY
ncbi:vitelline membrane protein Vm26Ab-like [Condylostylus longicornis]|uniref:vitelline membrane protein Vm26Ab-like n=1 Tax=Condylostylus longicornis TaxID=2530218 RepID=UPI00244DB632|nr:vitelline membrane protein Vm26Ab-like [Condylostylus longicornis]